MTTVHPPDYVLHLSTGEKISVAEFDPEVVPALRSQAARHMAAPALERCTFVPRDVLEEAKGGLDTRLKPLLRTPPVGALLKMSRPSCGDRSGCSMYDKKKCLAGNVSRTGGAFPECWRFDPGVTTPGSFDAESLAAELGTAIVLVWRRGAYAIVVE